MCETYQTSLNERKWRNFDNITDSYLSRKTNFLYIQFTPTLILRFASFILTLTANVHPGVLSKVIVYSFNISRLV